MVEEFTRHKWINILPAAEQLAAGTGSEGPESVGPEFVEPGFAGPEMYQGYKGQGFLQLQAGLVYCSPGPAELNHHHLNLK